MMTTLQLRNELSHFLKNYITTHDEAVKFLDWAGITHHQIENQSKLYYLQHDAQLELTDSEVENIFEAIREHFATTFTYTPTL
jgi:TFIIF-interacting CTD phosphatase-like protein